MKNFHMETLSELISEWPTERLEEYITQLEQRQLDLGEWIRHLKTIRRKKMRKPALDTGTRGGMG